eukprot:6372583-Prymnesium_polylepis.1
MVIGSSFIECSQKLVESWWCLSGGTVELQVWSSDNGSCGHGPHRLGARDGMETAREQCVN